MNPEVLTRSVQRSDGRGLFPWEALRSDLEALTGGGEIIWAGPDPFLSPWLARAVQLANDKGYKSWACVDGSTGAHPARVAAAADAGLVGVVVPSQGADDWRRAAEACGLRTARTWDGAESTLARAVAENASLRWPEGQRPSAEALRNALIVAEAAGIALRATYGPQDAPLRLTWSSAVAQLLAPPAPNGIAGASWSIGRVPDPEQAAAVRALGVQTPDLPRCHGGEPTTPRNPTDPKCTPCTARMSCVGPTASFPAQYDPAFRPLPSGARILVIGEHRADWEALSPAADAFRALGFHVEAIGPFAAEDAPGVAGAPARVEALRRQAWRAADCAGADLVVTTEALVDRYRAHPTMRANTRLVALPAATGSDGSTESPKGPPPWPWALVRRWAFGSLR